jgi:hypothetical protein
LKYVVQGKHFLKAVFLFDLLIVAMLDHLFFDQNRFEVSVDHSF